jgi:aquaporin Z
MKHAIQSHWPEYLMEAAELGSFMISAAFCTILLYHPSSPLIRAIPTEFIRRVLMGSAMGLTAIAIIYSPWGKQSGAHMNPVFTLTFFRLGKVAPWDAIFYIIAQFIGGIAGVAIVAAFAKTLLSHPSVNYVVTIPGAGGPWIAFGGEASISFILLVLVLFVSNQPKLARFTGIFAGACVALFIIFESPLSGMSMNPARTFGSAVFPQYWNSLWIYFTAPLLAMLLATEIYPLLKGHVFCAKYHHHSQYRCIFCDFQSKNAAQTTKAKSDQAIAAKLTNRASPR